MWQNISGLIFQLNKQNPEKKNLRGKTVTVLKNNWLPWELMSVWRERESPRASDQWPNTSSLESTATTNSSAPSQ